MKKNLFYLAALALSVAFTGCSSDEPVATANGGSTLTPSTGIPVQFNAARDLAAAKKILFGKTGDANQDDAVDTDDEVLYDDVHYGATLTPIYWEDDDVITIFSYGTPSQSADYVATPLADRTSASLAPDDPEMYLSWNAGTDTEGGAAQTFVAIYPAGDTSNPAASTFTIPATQSGTTKDIHMVALAANQRNIPTGLAGADADGEEVVLNFTSITTVIELNITSAHALTAISVTSSDATPLANTFTYNIENTITATGEGSPSVTVNNATAIATDQVYLSIAPVDLPNLIFTFTDEDDNIVTKTYTPASGGIIGGNLYRFNVALTAADFEPEVSDRVYLGIGVGGTVDAGTQVATPLYFAKGNLIATYDAGVLIAANNTSNVHPNSYFIANQAAGKFTANDDYSSTTFITAGSSPQEIDLFKVGKLFNTTGGVEPYPWNANYWVANNTAPSIDPAAGIDFSTEDNAVDYDLVSYVAGNTAIGSSVPDGYRSATYAEWTAVFNNCSSYWYSGTGTTAAKAGTAGGNAVAIGAALTIDISGYPEYDFIKNGIKGLFILAPSTSSAVDNYIFLPATGYRNGTSVYTRGTGGYCWVGTLDSSDANFAYGLNFDSGVWDTHSYGRNNGFALRPVSAFPSE